MKNNFGYEYKPIIDRPARKQVDEYIPFTTTRSGDYNIWHNRYSGVECKQTRGDRGNITRCCIKTDAGTTKSTKTSPICLHFAMGNCFKGEECRYKHQLPQEEDEKQNGITKDIFGRERHLTDREDMGGIGKFSRENRTLYVSGISFNVPLEEIEEILRKHFAEWGELEYIRIIPSNHIAFVRYKLRGCAEFAKVSMADQSLDNNEQLNIRWANEDPNPIAKEIEKQSIAKQYLNQIQTIMNERKEERIRKDEYSGNIDLGKRKVKVLYSEDNIKKEKKEEEKDIELGFKYSVSYENKDDEQKVKEKIEENKEKYVENKYTNFMHPYTYGFYNLKQFSKSKKSNNK